MINNFIEQYLEQFKPHAQSIGFKASAYAERILAQLQEISDNTEINNPDKYDRAFHFSVQPGTTIQVATVPTGEVWKFVYAMVDGVGVATTVRVMNNGATVWGKTATTPESMAPGYKFHGGSLIEITAIASAADVHLVFEIEQPQAVRTGIAGGTYEWVPDHSTLDPDPRQEANLTSRHASPGVFAGTNVIGDRAGTYMGDS